MTVPSSLVGVVLTLLSIVLSLIASAHVVLRKRDTRAAIGWIGLIWLSPFVGTLAYVLLGINRINRKARSLRRDQPRSPTSVAPSCSIEQLRQRLGPGAEHLVSLARLVGAATGQPLLAGNAVEPLFGGDQAYPAMLQAIDDAERSVGLATYIFNDDPVGLLFVEALDRAVRRGVAVRVLVDDLGARYDWPTIFRPLQRAGIPHASFLPTLVPGYLPYMNLRNHRKILVCDGRVGFTGGMNIDKDFYHALGTKYPRTDLHFRLRGPVVADLSRTFADDWVFATDELLTGEEWFPSLALEGPILARGVPDGPDQTEGTLRTTLLGAITAAQHSLAILTPYFLPDAALLSALYVAALRGVRVHLVMPQENNLPTVHQASRAILGEILEGGCHAWYSPPPFDHSKLMIVDGAWTFIGSANWDARSLRLNFEFNVECYDPDFATVMGRFFDSKLQHAEPITLEMINSRSLPAKLRDGVARLFSPYL